MLQTYSNFNLINLKVLNNLSKLTIRNASTACKSIAEKQKKKQVLQEHLGLSYQRSAAVLRNNPYLQTVDSRRMQDSIMTLQKMGIECEDIHEYPYTMAIHSNTLEHNYMYLKETGFTHVSAQILLRFRTIVKKPISLLKAHNIIPDNTDVPVRLFSYLNPRPTSLPILSSFSDEETIVHVHEVIFKHYLVWRLETTIEDIEKVFKTYDRFKYKSYKIMSDTVKLLTEDLGFPYKKILQQGYLFQINPKSVKEIMKTFPTLGGVDIKTVFYKLPKIISVSPENIVEIHKYLKEFGISDEAIQKCFEIYTLAPESVLYRLNELKKIPEFEVLTRHPRVVRLILCQNKAKLRLEHLQKLKVKCASINVLCASDIVFEKYAQEGNDRTKGFDLVHYLSMELNLAFKTIRQKLAVNPHWCHVPLTTVQNTLKYLLLQGITISEIGRMPIILLYPRELVRDAFREINSNPDTTNVRLSARERLNLCLYFIERKHHFSGDGLWHNSSQEAEVSAA